MALGFLGLMPDQFWNLTPREFQLMIKGYRQKEENDRFWIAWSTSLIRNVHLKKRDQKSAKQLLKFMKEKPKKDTRPAGEQLNDFLGDSKSREEKKKVKEDKAREAIKSIMEKRKRKKEKEKDNA